MYAPTKQFLELPSPTALNTHICNVPYILVPNVGDGGVTVVAKVRHECALVNLKHHN